MITLAHTLLAPTLLLCQDTAPAAQPAPLFDLWIDNMSGMLVSPKDAGLARALGMIDARLLELPLELEGAMPPMPPQMFPVLTRLALGRKSLRVFAVDDMNSPLPVALRFEMHEGSPEAAAQMADTLFGLLEEMGAPLGPVGANGLASLETPDGPPVDLGAVGEAFVVDFGGAAAGPGGPRPAGLPTGARPVMTLNADIGRSFELFTSFMAEMAPDEAEEFLFVMETAGLMDMKFEMALGLDDERAHGALRMPGYAATMRAQGIMPERGLTAADLALVPTDAEWASVSTFNARGTLDQLVGMFTAMAEMEGEDLGDPIAMLRDEIGIDLRADLIDHMGSVFALYSSKTTGGGGMLSTVAVVEISNKEGLGATLEQLVDMVDHAGAVNANGYVRTRRWKHGEADLYTLAFPGMPIPLEVTLALSERYLVAGITPQATIAALGQIVGGGGGLLANSAFTRQLAADPIGAYGVQFVDTAAMASDAYGLTSLLCSAIANAMRSPGTDRDPGLVMPTYSDFIAGSLATVSVRLMNGDDYVELSRGDRSMLVNLAGGIGMIASSPLAVAFGVGALGGVIMEARSAPAFDSSLDGMGYIDWDELHELGYTDETDGLGYIDWEEYYEGTEEVTDEPVPAPDEPKKDEDN